VALPLDALAWVVALPAAVWSRYEFSPDSAHLIAVLTLAMLAVVLQSGIGHARYLYRGRYPFGTFFEVRAVSSTVLATAACVLIVDLALPGRRLVPASSPVIGGVIALVLMLGGRYAYRLRHDRDQRPDARRAAPALLFGAGAAADSLLRAVLGDRRSPYLPVGLLDDDPDKAELHLHGVPVLGGRRDLARAVTSTGARTVILSVARAEGELIRDIQSRTVAAGAEFKVVPSVRELLCGEADLADVRDARIEDLLGRRQIEIDLDQISGYVTGKRILVTGAGGSIGSELCRQLHRIGPAELIMLDRDESALHAVQLALYGRALLDSPELVLADLRDTDAVARVFAERRPQVVFHAAALKHLPLLQAHPAEAVRTNVWGTLTLLEQARDVERFVNVSTDKAADPVSVLGYSKRITERLTAHAASIYQGTFLNVRFGNVLGSRGSMLSAFTAQAAAGGPITVTHPDVARYFMTVQEAAQLVIQAAAIGGGGDALVLDMGQPVQIAEVARQVARRAPRRVEIVYTGLRAGEKLVEVMYGENEAATDSAHPLIKTVAVPPLAPDHARALDPLADPVDVVSELARVARLSALPRPVHAGPPQPPTPGALSTPAPGILTR
jgi:FlaA1/EpsC-like NDP-sugar epimerase